MEDGPVPPDRKGIRNIHSQDSEQSFHPFYREINDKIFELFRHMSRVPDRGNTNNTRGSVQLDE